MSQLSCSEARRCTARSVAGSTASEGSGVVGGGQRNDGMLPVHGDRDGTGTRSNRTPGSRPAAILGAAIAYSASAAGLTGVRHRSARAAAPTGRRRLQAEIAEGLRHVFGSKELRAPALTATLTHLGAQMINAVLPVLFIRDLGLSAGVLGLYWAAGGLGILLGAGGARRLAARFGHGRALGLAGLRFAPAGPAVALAGRGPWLWGATADRQPRRRRGWTTCSASACASA
ncbi:hypothetical protein ACFV7R_30725 [Streptomyces sp. NPDC059866]|uniref:hypothetical protein n=1 Tax=Streptomyces sp. NPDC059866 TaxID=3346978 RepID=UPI0036494AE5